MTVINNVISSAITNGNFNNNSEFTVLDNINTDGGALNIESGNIYLTILLLIYLAGCVISFIYTTISIGIIIRAIRKGKCIRTDNGIKIIISENKNISSFSWMKYIILSRNDYDEAGETIIVHEKAHINLHHTYDLIIAQACIIIQWFNPAAWLLYQELQNIHEYEADENVLRQGVNARQYQLLLIKKAVGTRLYSMANSFNHSNLKKRITMMLQKKSSSWARLKYAYVLPLAAIILAACTNKEVSQKMDEISNAKISNFSSKAEINESGIENPDDFVFVSVEKMPEFPGGDAALLKWITENINYPEIAKENNITGRVNCTLTVNADGSVSDVKVIRSIDPNLDNEAVRVLSALPKFKPGENKGKAVRVKYSVPVRFGPKPENSDVAVEKNSSSTPQEPKTDPNDPSVFLSVEKTPEFPGGDAALLRWIADNVNYPTTAAENGIQGRVNCAFIVEPDGSITNVKVTRPLDNELDAESIRVLSLLPKFTPGTQKGKAVRVRYSVPVRFQLKK